MMAKAWMKQDQAPQAEARDTWNTLEAEFNEERKAMLMASAESDKIKAMMNEKYGPGTIKYGSEIKQPEMKTPQAIFEFSQRNPAANGGRMGFDAGGMAKLVSYVESLPKGTTVTTKMLEDYVKKSKINVNIKNFFDRKAPSIKGYTFDTSFQGSKLTDVEKTNIETFGKTKYDNLSIGDQFRVRRGDDVGKLAPEKQAKQIYKKEYDKAYKFYKDKGLEIDFTAEENIRQNIRKNKGKFVAPTKKLKAEPGLSSIFKNYTKADLIKDLKKGKDLGEISIEYFDKNEKEILKVLEGKRDYTKPLGRLSTDLGAAIRQDEEAIKLYDKIKKKNTFKQLGIKKKYVSELETLLPFAQEQGLVPKVNSKGVKIDTASKYFQHAYKVKRDPIAKLFGFYEKVGIEHPGGVARALIFDDPATLNEIVATMPDTNTISGRTYDSYATGQARFFEKTGDAKYIKSINKIILNKQKEFGKPRTILDVDGDTVTRRKTPFSLTDPNLKTDAKSFINEYVSQGGSKRENFNKLDKSLQKSILAFEEGNKIEGNKFLKTALKDTGAEEQFKTILQKFCGYGQAQGGRIGLSNGSCSLDESQKGFTQYMEDAKNGKISTTSKAGAELAENAAKLAGKSMSFGKLFFGWTVAPEVVIEGAIGLHKYFDKGENVDQVLAKSYLTKPLRMLYDQTDGKTGIPGTEELLIKNSNIGPGGLEQFEIQKLESRLASLNNSLEKALIDDEAGLSEVDIGQLQNTIANTAFKLKMKKQSQKEGAGLEAALEEINLAKGEYQDKVGATKNFGKVNYDDATLISKSTGRGGRTGGIEQELIGKTKPNYTTVDKNIFSKDYRPLDEAQFNVIENALKRHPDIGMPDNLTYKLNPLNREVLQQKALPLARADAMNTIGMKGASDSFFKGTYTPKEKPVYDFSEGGITGLRSKYEYKK